MPLGTPPRARRNASDADPNEDQNDLLDSDDIVGAARESLSRLRLKIPKRPKDAKGDDLDPIFPSNITKVTSDELGKLHGQFNAMAAYAFAQLSILDIAHEVEAHNDKLQRTLVSLKGQGSVKDREAQGLTHKKSRSRSQIHFEKLAIYKMARAIAEGFDRKAKALSREIARRQGDLDRERE